jgi:hypothetical protein
MQLEQPPGRPPVQLVSKAIIYPMLPDGFYSGVENR